MIRPLRSLLLVVALLFAQHAAMLHDLAHAQHELAAAKQGPGKAPALGHGVEVCAAFGALAHALGDFVSVFQASRTHGPAYCFTPRDFAVPARVVFDSRAPPSFS